MSSAFILQKGASGELKSIAWAISRIKRFFLLLRNLESTRVQV
jgi:hypothetical protein